MGQGACRRSDFRCLQGAHGQGQRTRVLVCGGPGATLPRARQYRKERKASNSAMGRRHKKLPNANQAQLLPKGYHPAKKVVIPCSPHRSISLCPQDYQSRSALMPRLNHQSRTKGSSRPDHKTSATFSRNPKLGSEPAQLPQAVQQAGVMPRHQGNHQAPITPATGTAVLTLPCPDSWARVSAPPFPHSECPAALPLGSNHHVETPSAPDHFGKPPSDSDHLPMISNGCDHRAEDQSCPDHKPKTMPVPTLNHNFQPSAVLLQRPSPWTSASQGSRSRPKIASSLERYLNHWHRAIFSPLTCADWPGATPSDPDPCVKGITSRTSCPDQFLRPKTALLRHPEHNPWILKAPTSSCSIQQVRTTSVPSPCPNNREITTTFVPVQFPASPAENPPGLHFEAQDSTIPSAVQPDLQDIPLPNLSGTTEAPLIIPNHLQNKEPSCNSAHQAKTLLNSDHWPMVLPHLNCWATPQSSPDQSVVQYIDHQTKPPLRPDRHKLVAPPSPDTIFTESLSPLKIWAMPLPDSEHEMEVLPTANKLARPPAVPNQWLKAMSGPNAWEEVSMDCNHCIKAPLDTYQEKIESDPNHCAKAPLDTYQQGKIASHPNDWAQAPLDFYKHEEMASHPRHWDNAALQSDCRVTALQSPHCQDQIPPDKEHQADAVSTEHCDNTVMVLDNWVTTLSDTDQQVEIESDAIHWGKATVDPHHNSIGPLSPDNQTLISPDVGLQNEDIPDLEHQNGTKIVQDMITKSLPASCHWVEAIPDPKHYITPVDLHYETKTKIGLKNTIMDTPGHDHAVVLPVIPEHQNEDILKFCHQKDAESLLDLDYESKFVSDQESIDILDSDHQSKAQEVPVYGALLPLIPDCQEENLSDYNDQDDDVLLLPSSDTETLPPSDLDNDGKIPLRTNYQSNILPAFDHQTEEALDAPNQVTLPSILDKDFEILLNSDNCNKTLLFSQHQTMLSPDKPKLRQPSSCSEKGVVSSNQNQKAMQMSTNSKILDTVELNLQTPQRSCHWADVPLDSKHKVAHQQSISHQLTPPPRLKSLVEDHLDLRHQTETPPSCKHQVKCQPFMNNWARSPNPLTEDGKNKESAWCLTYIKPYTIEGGNISHRTINSIIRSIPQEKIKNDIYKQLLLQHMSECSNFENGLCLTSTYTVCLICASWIPYGCPHVQEMKDACKAQLLSISSLLPGSKEEMNVKFILQVPQLEAGCVFTVPYPDYGFSHHLHYKPGKSFHVPLGTSKSMTFLLQEPGTKLTWLDFIRGKPYHPYGKKTSWKSTFTLRENAYKLHQRRRDKGI